MIDVPGAGLGIGRREVEAPEQLIISFRVSAALLSPLLEMRQLGAEAIDAWLHSPEHKANMLRDQFTEIGIGIAWASILAMPYAILASNLPQAKLGIYMGLFNVFIVVPQLLVATVMRLRSEEYFIAFVIRLQNARVSASSSASSRWMRRRARKDRRK